MHGAGSRVCGERCWTNRIDGINHHPRFYEWIRKGTEKIPYYVHKRSASYQDMKEEDSLLYMAGLYTDIEVDGIYFQGRCW
jgi:hypothetical protein